MKRLNSPLLHWAPSILYRLLRNLPRLSQCTTITLSALPTGILRLALSYNAVLGTLLIYILTQLLSLVPWYCC
jgi:hypothetical protein